MLIEPRRGARVAGPRRRSDPLAEHAELVDAAGDVRRATAVLEAHLRATLDAVLAPRSSAAE